MSNCAVPNARIVDAIEKRRDPVPAPYGIGATTVAAFSARARPGLGVSMPVTWAELKTLDSAAEWAVSNCRRRLEAMTSHDPWEAYIRTRQSMTRAAAQLAQT